MRVKTVLLSAVAILLEMGAAPARAQSSDVAVSWEKALVYLPGHADSVTVADIPTDERQPVVLYFHGCGGLNQENDRPWAKYIAGLGFVVVAPDRFARADKRPSCWPNRNPAAQTMRREEIRYGLEQVAASPWADQKNVFVMAFSEGADNLAVSPVSGVSGVILSSWTCHRVTSLGIAEGIPILSIMWDQRSRWKFWDRGELDCIHRFDQRAGFETATIHGRGHATYRQSIARNAVQEFLRAHIVHPAHPAIASDRTRGG